MQQVLVSYIEDNFDAAKRNIADAFERDVRAELVHLTKLFRKFIIGASGANPKARGNLTTVSKGTYNPSTSLQSKLPPWTPRGAAYLRDKQSIVGHKNWFDYDGVLGKAFAAENLGGGNYLGSTVFEDMFGPVSVQVLRNNAQTGTDVGAKLKTGKGKAKLQLGTVRVRALGSVSLQMLQASSSYNTGLMSLVHAYDPEVGHRLGNAWNYRPTLEPFLEFFLERSIPQAVTERIRKGVIGGNLFRKPR